MQKQLTSIRSIALALVIAATACGTIHGATPGRAGIQAPAPYDATHLDAGNVDKTGDGVSGNVQNDTFGPQLVP
jgi:ABC-type oligopeptide transport system substrate-binding subunit